MTPLDLHVLGLNNDDTCSLTPSPFLRGEQSTCNALGVDLFGLWESYPHVGQVSRPSWTSPEIRGKYVDVEGELSGDLLAALTFTPPSSDNLGLPQPYPPQEIYVASNSNSVFAPNDPLALVLTMSEMRFLAPHLPGSSLPPPSSEGSLGPSFHQPHWNIGGDRPAELCISPSLLHAPSSDLAILETEFALASAAASQDMARRNSHKTRIAAHSHISSRTRSHHTKPYAHPPIPLSSSSPTPLLTSITPTSTQAPEVICTRRRNLALRAPDSSDWRTLSEPVDRWKCPHCPYVQTNHRTADLKRHIGTHTTPREAKDALWVCCGVPFWEALAGIHGVEVAQNAWNEEQFDFHGESMIGGCRKTFCRGDALGRHLRRQRGPGRCLGDEKAAWQLGNKRTQ